MYCVFLGKTVGTVSPASDSVTTAMIQSNAVNNAKMADDAIGVAELSATGTASSSTFLRGDNAWASAGGDNTPGFMAYLSSTQTVSNDTSTKVVFQAEVYDSDSAYDTSTGRFTVPSGEGGKYLFYIRISFDSESAGAMDKCSVEFKKNGSGFVEQETNFTNNPVRKAQIVCPIVLDLSASDYVEVFALIDSSNSLKFEGGSYKTTFGGHKLIGV